jgi:integrase/recombinase XerD
MNKMEHLLLESHYYQQWFKLTDVRKSTLENYSYHLRRFEHYLVVEKGLTDELNFDKFIYYPEDDTYLAINEKFISNYFSYLESSQMTNQSLYMSVSALRNFFGFLKDVRLIKYNPMAYFKNPYYDPKLFDRSIAFQDCAKLMKAAQWLDRSDPFLQKHSVLVLLMFTTGLRRNEIGKLTIEQLDFERNMIYVDRGQKTKANTVFMPRILSLALNRLINHPTHTKWQNAGNSNVFFSTKGKKFNHITLNDLLKKLCHKAEIHKVTSHCLRHSMASLLLSRGVDISIIQRQLRHKFIETTIRYLPTATVDEIPF